MKTQTRKRILSVRVITDTDTDPDLSYLGEYSNTACEVSIDRQERGDMSRGEYRYFNVGCGEPDYIEADYARMEAYNRNEWCCIGIRAEAKVQLTGDLVQTISSGGLWGIESDSDKEYLSEVRHEQLNELAAELRAIGFARGAIDRAFESISDE